MAQRKALGERAISQLKFIIERSIVEQESKNPQKRTNSSASSIHSLDIRFLGQERNLLFERKIFSS